MNIEYKFTIRFHNGTTKTRKIPIDKQTFPFLVMRLRYQYPKADIDWEGSDGSTGTTQIGAQ